MRSGANIIVLTTCGSAAVARKIARALVERRLAACVNVATAPVESIYRWKDKIERAKEYVLLIKTTLGRFGAVERAIREAHSYEVPEIIAVPIARGSREYLRWLGENVRQ